MFVAMKKKFLLTLLIPAFISVTGCVGSPSAETNSPAIAQETPVAEKQEEADTASFAEVLSTYVDAQGLVNYQALQGDRKQLDTYNNSLQAINQASFTKWSEAAQIALLINAYNSLTLKAIINEAPLKASIKDITGVWRFNKHGILQDEKTLNNIEHDILRVDYNEPRIHAALVCAALSCPYLRQEPYTAENLDAQLDDQVEIFLSRQEVFEIDRDQGEVRLSAIFDWFKDDWIASFGTDEGFTGSDGERAVLNFITEYISEEDSAYLKAGDYKIKYTKYDWSLNVQS